MSRTTSHRPLALALVMVTLFWCVAAAQAITINITATVNGVPNTQLGTIDATYAGGVEEGTFQLDNAQLGLMDDPCRQFRWFQIITEDTDPINYNGNPLNAPLVDPPSGGWDYQAGQGGADTSPFYENDDGGNYAFPNYSGTFNVFGGNNNVAVHDANTGTSRTQDVPGTTNATA